MLVIRKNNSVFPKLEPAWDERLTASLAASVAPPSLKERFSGRRIVFSTGRENDGTGLYYYRARYYSPTLQRFLGEDPIGFAGGDVNLYAYVGNNPLRWRDPMGFRPGDSYSTLDAAAIDAINDINETSISEGKEYAGGLYQNSDGTYSYTAPNEGTKDSSSPGRLPDGKTNQGSYHTHGANDHGYDNENFSSADQFLSELAGKPAYLGTPGRKIKKYIPEKGLRMRGKDTRLKKQKLGGRK
jgi:RHS repeat-associated protein